eukprot:gnl/TRDRNA2_/TRDRNA2_175656_c1_seq2.p1 gnl/TRDRNA2_/TRDRNA2_175656_c1~~gnl/TRDRNA2_/TRDRNA2_175656_c1_seq2.p1  ORF type:complete len:571 (+),score=127.38 gnl/TRDRNA2_/TRDRNA2_175656_c1_seq2:125-1837(+)
MDSNAMDLLAAMQAQQKALLQSMSAGASGASNPAGAGGGAMGLLEQARLQQAGGLPMQPGQMPLPFMLPGPMSGASASSSSDLGRKPDMPEALMPEVVRLESQAARRKAQLTEMKKKYEDKEQAEKDQAEKMRCHLHKTPKNKGCKFCDKWKQAIDQADKKKTQELEKFTEYCKSGTAKAATTFSTSSSDPLPLEGGKTFNIPTLLREHIVESAHYKVLEKMDSIDQIVEEIYQYADTVEPYSMAGQTPSALFCCLYKLFNMGLSRVELQRLLDDRNNVYVRCCGFLYVRFGIPSDQLWSWLDEYILDDEEVRPQKDSDAGVTIGEYVEGLLNQERYFGTVLPRLPMSAKRTLELKLAVVPQNRKRFQANQGNLDVYERRDVQVEVLSDEGSWLKGKTSKLIDEFPSRPKVRVRLDDGSQIVAQLGKVIIVDDRYPSPGGSKQNPDNVDWSRSKGKSESELLEEMRERERNRAVTGAKDYARKPVSVKAACSLPWQGKESHKLAEDETYVKERARKRSPSVDRELERRRSAEHRAQMQKVFEKYGMQKSAEAQQKNPMTDISGPDTLRLG